MLPTWEEVEALIRAEAAAFAQRVREAARGSTTEATFRDRLMPVLADFCEKVGIEFTPKGGYSLLSGKKPDTVFNRFIIEYKSPGILEDSNAHPQNKKAIAQLKDYMQEIAKQEKHQADRMAGVVLDGNYLIFLRKFDTGWYEDSPVAVSPESVARFLRYLTSLSYGVALTAENLVKDFGIEHPRTPRIVQSLEAALRAPPAPLVAKLFQQWKTMFSEVIEYKEAFSSTKLRELGKFAAKVGVDLKEPEPFFFTLHTYFALLVKLLAWLALYRYLGGKRAAPSFGKMATLSSEELKRDLFRMEHGEVFRDIYGIRNLLEGDLFLWYLYAWNDQIESALRELITRLSDYDPATLGVDPKEARDLFKKLYHKLTPKDIRHNLGEYYTPDWLAQRLLNQVDISFFTDDPAQSSYLKENLLKLRFLDPACGSGTFLALIIKRMREVGKALLIPEHAVLEAILKNVVGVDLNPLAVITARTTYILALGELLESKRRDIDIPVYLADSIVMPSRGKDLWTSGIYQLPTSVGPFLVPQEVVHQQRFNTLCQLLDDGVSDQVSVETFIENCRAHLNLEPEALEKAKEPLSALYQRISELHNERFNGLWARLLRNGFAPLFIGEFHYVVGNPPWVNWENLPDGYRDRTDVRRLWTFHGLFPHSGMDTILGKGKKDISVLMLYEAMRRYLHDGGKLSFVITQSVFKTAGAGQGFRRFLLGDGTYIKVLHVDDMVELQPFEGAANRTSVVVLQKGRETTYPVPYTYWRKTEEAKGKSIGFDTDLPEVVKLTQRLRFHAEPVNPNDKTSAWLTGRPLAIKAIKKVLGKSDYEAHEGVNTGGANGVYWLNIRERLPDGSVEVENITQGQKREVESTQAVLEADLVYPLLRGRDVKRWLAEPSAYILMVQDPVKRRGIDEREMQLHYRKTWSYLKQFEAVLRSRAAYKRYFRGDAPFYSMFDVGDYTFAPYKVVWAGFGVTRMMAVVVGQIGNKAVMSNQAMHPFVGLGSEIEAHFLCACLNSTAFDYGVQSHTQRGGKSFAQSNILEQLRIPKFDSQNPLHLRLAELSEKAHQLAQRGDEVGLKRVEEEIDRQAARLWGLTDKELGEIKRCLAEIG